MAAGPLWNPSDKAPGLTITDNGQTITGGPTGGGPLCARAVIGKSSGLWYFEGRGTTPANGQSYGLGIARDTFPVATAPYLGSDALSYGWVRSAGSVYSNGAPVFTPGAFADNDILMFAVDLNTFKIHFGKNGTWLGSYNPNAGTGGSSITPGTYFPAGYARDVDTATLVSPLVYSPPTGYAAWPANNAPPANVTGAQTLTKATQTGSVAAVVKASGAQTMLTATQASSVAVLPMLSNVTGAQTMSAVTQTSSITLGPRPGVNGAQTMSAVTQTSSITSRIDVTGQQLLAPVQQSSNVHAEGSRIVTGNQLLAPVINRAAIGTSPTPRRIIPGKLPSGANGLRISQPGYDAGTEPVDNERMIFSSEWPEAMAIHAQGATKFTCGFGGSTVQTYPFASLGYVPFVEFVCRSNADAIGGNTWPDTGVYYPRNALSVPYLLVLGADGANYLRLNILDGAIRIEGAVRNGPSNNTFGYPLNWWVYWTIFKKKANA